MGNKKFILMVLLGILILTLEVILSKFIVINAYVPTESMDSTIEKTNCLLGNRLFKEIKKGDIIIFYKKDESNTLLVKRVIALGGDKVRIDGNDIYVNDKKLYEPYVSSKHEDLIQKEFIVEKDSYFVCGDNRANSYDGRYWSNPNVKRSDVVAVAKYKYNVNPLNGGIFIKELD